MDIKTIGAVIVVVALAALIYLEVQKRTTFAKLEAYMREGSMEEYLKLLDRPLTSVLYPKYNVLFMRLNAAIVMGDTAQATELIERMETLKMTEEQTTALAIRAFNFYVEIEDEPRAVRALDYIEKHGDASAARVSRRTYEIFLKGSDAYIGEMEQALEHAEQVEQAMLCQLLAIQYGNRGDARRADSYHERAERLMNAAGTTK